MRTHQRNKRIVFFDFSVKNTGDKECIITFGIYNSGLIKNGYTELISETVSPRETKQFEFELSAFEHLTDCTPTLDILGTATLESFTIYQKRLEKYTVIEGVINERSALPDPQQSDYPNCRFTARFAGNTILSGESCPKEIALIIEGFENYKSLETDSLKAGDKVQCLVIPFECIPEDQQSTQQADDLNLFMLDNYYVIDICRIKSYRENHLMPKSGIFFSDGNENYISLYERHINDPISQPLIDAQERSIQKDLQKMNLLLEGYDDDSVSCFNDQFAEEWEKEKKNDPNGYNRVGNYVWRNIDNSYWCLPEQYTLLSKPDELTQETIDSFVALKKACEVNGTQLIVSLVPDLYVVSSRVINKSFRNIIDYQTAIFVKQLSENGIESIYSADAIILNYNRYPFAFFYPSNGHPSDTTQDVITDILSERLKRYNFDKIPDFELFSEKQSPHVYGDNTKYLYPDNCDIGNNKAGISYTNREILYNGKTLLRSKDAQFITIGNSYQQTPMNHPDSVPTLLAFKLGTAVDWYRSGGQGPFSDVLMQFLTRADYFLKNKKVLIMYVGTDHLRSVNKSGCFLNIQYLDKTRLILNNKKCISHFIPESNTKDESFENETIWGSLSNMDKSCFSIKESGETLYTLALNQYNNSTIDDSKPIICVVPAACLPQTSCKLCINNQTQTIPSFFWLNESKFFSLAFELPAGTREITIKAEGNSGTLFVIKDIQIWQ